MCFQVVQSQKHSVTLLRLCVAARSEGVISLFLGTPLTEVTLAGLGLALILGVLLLVTCFF